MKLILHSHVEQIVLQYFSVNVHDVHAAICKKLSCCRLETVTVLAIGMDANNFSSNLILHIKCFDLTVTIITFAMSICSLFAGD